MTGPGGDPRKKGAALWAAVVAGILLAYTLGYGPWCWALGKWGPNRQSIRVTAQLYRPLSWLSQNGPLRRPLGAYGDWWFEWGNSNPDHIPTPSPAHDR